MKRRGIIIFLLMQVCFIVLGFALFFGLRNLKESQQEDISAMVQACDFSEWVGKAADEGALKETGHPYRVLPPGSMYTADYDPERINLYTDDENIVREVNCR